MHSVYSDGSETVEGLIAAAQGMRLAGIAVTDHDCLRQLSSIRAAARGAAVPVLAGVEVSAMDPATGRKLHVLAYGLEATPAGDGPLERMGGRHAFRPHAAVAVAGVDHYARR